MRLAPAYRDFWRLALPIYLIERNFWCFFTPVFCWELFCAPRPPAITLLARLVTGLFGGVIGSIVFAIITDLFAFEQRGRVMGFVQTAFAASQVMGIPVGLYLSNMWGWHAPFYMIVAVGAGAGVLILIFLRPIDQHLSMQKQQKPLRHLLETVSTPRYLQAFATTALLATGGFMMMPFGSAYTVNNLGIAMDKLPLIYMVTGCFTIFAGPLIGKVSDRLGKFKVFMAGSLLTIIMVAYYTRMGVSPMWLVIAVSVVMFVGIFSRIIPSQALMSAIPEPRSRGAFMAVSASIQQISGGIAAALAGAIVLSTSSGALERFDVLGNVVIGAILITLFLMWRISKKIEIPTGAP